MAKKVEEMGLQEKVLELARAGHSRREIANLLSTKEDRLSHMSIARFLRNDGSGEVKDASEEQLRGLDANISILEEEVDRELDFADGYRANRKTTPVYGALTLLNALMNERAKLLARLKAAANDITGEQQEAKI